MIARRSCPAVGVPRTVGCLVCDCGWDDLRPSVRWVAGEDASRAGELALVGGLAGGAASRAGVRAPVLEVAVEEGSAFADALGAWGAEDRLVVPGAAALDCPELAAGLPTRSAINTAIRIPTPSTATMARAAARPC